MKQPHVVSVEIQPLIQTLEKEIAVVLDDVEGKNIIEYIISSIIYSITRIPNDKPKWSMSNTMLENNETLENITVFNTNYLSNIYQHLATHVPYLFLIDNYYNVINKNKLNVMSDDITLLIKEIDIEEWLALTMQTPVSDIINFDGYTPEKLR